MRSLHKALLRTLAFLTTVIASAHFAITSPSSFAAAGDVAQQSPKPRSFANPHDAMQAFAAAVKAADETSLKAMLGPEGESILRSGDRVEDKAMRDRFTAAYEAAHTIERRGGSKGWILVGKDEWALPIPLVKRGASWYFDGKAGKRELLNRRIGRNELFTMQSVLAYVDAQQEYYLRNPEQDKLLAYAQKFISTANKRDGLYFPTTAGERPSPLGPLFDARHAAGYLDDAGGKPGPYHGYYYKILKAQGPKATGGAYDYIANGKMIGGFALVAHPATYGNSGVMTFIVNHDGVLYQKNLGSNTAAIAQKMTRFNPDETWQRL
jgi:hypothetical protein